MIRVGVERGGERALGGGGVADVGERAPAEHLHLHPLGRVGDRLEPALEERGELGAGAGGDVDRLQAREDVLVRGIDGGDRLERVAGVGRVVDLSCQRMAAR